MINVFRRTRGVFTKTSQEAEDFAAIVPKVIAFRELASFTILASAYHFRRILGISLSTLLGPITRSTDC